MLRKLVCMVSMLVVIATTSLSFAATGYVENGCWNGDANYPVIAYYGQMYIEVVRRDSVHKQTTGVCADSVCISSMVAGIASDEYPKYLSLAVRPVQINVIHFWIR